MAGGAGEGDTAVEAARTAHDEIHPLDGHLLHRIGQMQRIELLPPEVDLLAEVDLRRADARAGVAERAGRDIAAVLLDAGVVNARGRLAEPGAALPLGDRIFETEGQRCFRLTDSVYLTQDDIRQLQMAKGAIASGIELMAAQLGGGACSGAELQRAQTIADRAEFLELAALPEFQRTFAQSMRFCP